ncbi:MAG: glycosyltransferase family 2 protein [Actinomycetota bacterium]
MTSAQVDNEGIDQAAISAFIAEYGERATALPPLAIVIAAYNEEGAIGPVLDTLPKEISGLATATIVVSDGAADGTAAEAGAHGALVCDVPVNRGQGAALRLGYRLAREGGAQYIVTTDADGQYNPAEIELLMEPLLAGEADFVTGSRRLGSEETKDPVRKAGVRFFALAISVLTGQKISDTTFGLRAMRAEVTGAVQLEQPQYQASELLIGVITHGYRVAERAATIHKRQVGKSKKGNNAFYALKFSQVVGTTWWRERQRRGSVSAASLPAPRPAAEPEARANGAGSTASTASSASGSSSPASDPGLAALDPRSAKRT